MSDFAILLGRETSSPRTVRLTNAGAALELSGLGTHEVVPWWKLYRVADEGTTHRFRRVDRKDWELRVTKGSDRELLAHIGRRPLHRVIQPLRRLESLKFASVAIVVAYTVGQHAPAEFTAKSVPPWAERRLADGLVTEQAPNRCVRAGGEAAIRKILVRLDPELGREVHIVAIKFGGFVVTSTPGHTIFLFRSSMTEIDPLALPALLAHELSHIRHADPMAAAIRQNGYLGMWAFIVEGTGKSLELKFSGLEERRADLEAMAMMRRAGIPLRPAAMMFEEMRRSKAQNGFFGYDQRDFHFGIDDRAQRWALAAANDPSRSVPILSEIETDNLYNFCWAGPLSPAQRQAPSSTLDPGHGGVSSTPATG